MTDYLDHLLDELVPAERDPGAGATSSTAPAAPAAATPPRSRWSLRSCWRRPPGPR